MVKYDDNSRKCFGALSLSTYILQFKYTNLYDFLFLIGISKYLTDISKMIDVLYRTQYANIFPYTLIHFLNAENLEKLNHSKLATLFQKIFTIALYAIGVCIEYKYDMSNKDYVIAKLRENEKIQPLLELYSNQIYALMYYIISSQSIQEMQVISKPIFDLTIDIDLKKIENVRMLQAKINYFKKQLLDYCHIVRGELPEYESCGDKSFHG
jgi:hypothetical protein